MNRATTGKAGDSLEYLAAAIFQSQGFLVRRSVPLKLDNAVDATDIDVYGLKFVYPYQPVALVCDCKDRDRGQVNARVLWAKGLGQCLGASEVYVATRSARLETVHFARAHGVRVLTVQVLNEYGAQHALDMGVAYGHAHSTNMISLLARVENGFRVERQARDESVRAAQAIQMGHPYEDFNVSMERIEYLSSILHSLGDRVSDLRVAWAYCLSQYVVALAVHLLLICADTLTLSRSDRRNYILERLTYGSLQKRQAESIVQASLDFATEVLVPLQVDAARQRLPHASRLFAPPMYAEDVVGLVERALVNPRMYHSLPQVLDFTLVDEGLVAGKFDSDAFAETFPTLVGADALKAARNVFAFLRAHTSFTQSLLAPYAKEGSVSVSGAGVMDANGADAQVALPMGSDSQTNDEQLPSPRRRGRR
jgi:hypothetical protein